MSTLNSIKSQLQTLVTKAQAATSSSATDLTTQVTVLISGYGKGDSDGVALSDVEVYIADYYDSTSVSRTAGVVDVYQRVIVS